MGVVVVAARTLNIFSVVITYNGARWIRKGLDSLNNASTLPTKIIVVDNASTDDTVQVIRGFFPETHLIELKENIGFGRANNIGIAHALRQGADKVFLLNQDAWILPQTLEILATVMSQYSGYGILSPIHLTGKGDRFDHGFADYIRATSFGEDLFFNRVKSVYSLPFMNAAAWLVSCECFLTVGGFDPLFFVYGEDNDYCSRVIYHGFKIGLVPAAVIHHDRQDREPSAAAETTSKVLGRYELYVAPLVRLKDMRRSFRVEFYRHTKCVMLEALDCLFHGNFKSAAQWAFSAIHFGQCAAQIWRHKNICYKNGAHWLGMAVVAVVTVVQKSWSNA